jgi:hypothetical protein
VLNFGLPNDVYLDNGKDFRCKDFATGRKKQSVKIVHNGTKKSSLLTNLGINVHFALPYNAQAKPVERDFLKIKNYLSKHCVGYRGGNVVERPEKLKYEIKNEKITGFDEFKTLFDDFILNVLNKMPSNGKVLQGKSPDELWSEEFIVKKIISKDALKLFCMRTSKDISIGRNGVFDSQLQITYWAEWMIGFKGKKVFLRRDVNAYQEAWVFDSTSEEFLGEANANQASSFLAQTPVEKSEYKKAIEQKKKEKKALQEYIKCKFSPANSEIAANFKNALETKTVEKKPKISKISNTKMDEVVKQKAHVITLKTNYYTSKSQEPKQKIYLSEDEMMRELKMAGGVK